jgi:hypothetical protein
MKKIVMLLAVLLGTTVMVNANTFTKKATAKEVKANTIKKHKKVRKGTTKKVTVAKPAAAEKK